MTDQSRILVVDDEIQNLDLLEYLLESLGYKAVPAQSGQEALERLAPDIDLVLLDVMMPMMDGFEVARRIREHTEFGDLPIIMVTVLTGKEDRLRAVEAGANDFITKPVDKVELRVRMRSLLKMKWAQDAIKRYQLELEDLVEERTEALRESEERFRTVFQAAEDFIFVKDAKLCYTDVNPAMSNILQLDRADVIGRTNQDLFGADESKHLQNLERRVLKGQTIEAEYTLTVGGAPVAFSCMWAPLRDSLGEVTGICGIARDVTERRRRETETAPDREQYRSKAMKDTIKQLRLAAETDSLVLFLGESGSGKDHLARYLHEESARAGGPFLSINCAALSPELAESELFGHEAGAFTGAGGRKRGLLELAEGGTLLLNEIGELSLPLQAKLLSFLDTQSFIRVGGEKSITVNARLVAATNRDLEQEVKVGAFREDLFYRLNIFTIVVPPLRDRMEDITALVERLLTQLGEKMGLSHIPAAGPDAMSMICDYDWPGNVRELRNVLERAVILSDKNRIRPEDLGIRGVSRPPVADGGALNYLMSLEEQKSLHDMLLAAKEWYISESLQRCGGNMTEAAKLLGVSRDSLKHHMKSLGISRR